MALLSNISKAYVVVLFDIFVFTNFGLYQTDQAVPWDFWGLFGSVVGSIKFGKAGTFGQKLHFCICIFIPIFPFQHTSSENFAIELSDVLKMLFITDKAQYIYIRTVSSQLLITFGTFDSFPAGLGRNRVYCACCIAQMDHKPVQ